MYQHAASRASPAAVSYVQTIGQCWRLAGNVTIRCWGALEIARILAQDKNQTKNFKVSNKSTLFLVQRKIKILKINLVVISSSEEKCEKL